jgi:hypothetical protein
MVWPNKDKESTKPLGTLRGHTGPITVVNI